MPQLSMLLSKLFYLFLMFALSGWLQSFQIFAQRPNQKVEFTLSSGVKGAASVNYRSVDGRQVPDGKFEFVRDSIISGDDGVIYRTSHYSGTFRQGVKLGRWDFERSMLQPQMQGRSDGRTIIYDSDGSLRSVQVNFLNGQFHGIGKVHEVAIQNSAFSDTSYYNHAVFNQGVFIERLTAGNANKHLNINFGSNGFLNGELKLVDKNNGNKLQNIKFFEDGVLKSHKLILAGKEYELGYIQLLNNVDLDDTLNYQLVEVPISDERYSLLTKLAIRYQSASKNQKLDWQKILLRGEEFIQNSLNSFTMYQGDSIWNELPGSEPIQGPYVKLIERNYPEAEIQSLESLKVILFAVNQKLSYYFDDPNFEFNRFMSEDMAFYYEAMVQLKDAANNIESVVDFGLDHRTKYFDRDKALPMFFDPIVFQSQVNFEFGEKKLKRNYDFPEGFKWSNFQITAFSDYVNVLVDKVNELDAIMKPEVRSNQQQLLIIDKERELVLLRDSIVYLFSENNKGLNSYQVKYGPRISSFVESEFKRYAALPVRARKDKIDDMLLCYRNHLMSFSELKKLDDRVKHLQALYTRTTWNPFTFTDMDEIVKERVYNAYRNSLLDYVLDNMFGTGECGLLDGKLDNFSKIYRRMIELREQDTKETERLLRRVSSPKQIAEILQIDLTL